MYATQGVDSMIFTYFPKTYSIEKFDVGIEERTRNLQVVLYNKSSISDHHRTHDILAKIDGHHCFYSELHEISSKLVSYLIPHYVLIFHCL